MITPTHYQQSAVTDTVDWLCNNSGNPLAVLPVGTGKSIILNNLTKFFIDSYSSARILHLTHVKELISQNYKAIRKMWPDAPAGCYSASLGSRDLFSQIIFGGIQSIHDKAGLLGHVDAIIVDECFVAGTKIKTRYGSKKIEDILPGDVVSCASGSGKVLATFKKKSKKLVKVKLTNGQMVHCTQNHEIFTEKGWKQAWELEAGWRVFGEEEVQMLWNGFSPMDKSGRTRDHDILHERETLEGAKNLQSILRKEAKEPYAQQKITGENEEYANIYRPQTKDKRRERNRINGTAGGIYEPSMLGMDCGIPCKDKNENGERLSDKLQGGYRKSRKNASNRTRWIKPFSEKKKITRQKERRSIDVIRVESVEIDERSSDEYVYDIQVEGHPSYYANGILVHNCHLIPFKSDTMYRRFIDDLYKINPNMRIIGLTATHYRLQGGDLRYGNNAMFTDISYEYKISKALEDGYMTELWPKPGSDIPDTSSMHKRGGEFIVKEMQEAFDIDSITRHAVDEIIHYGMAENRRAWLVFASGVKHAENVSKYFNAKGISCEVVHGSSKRRDNILERFDSGDIKCVVNVDCLTTGYDNKYIDLIALLRKTASPGLLIQILGRGTRLVDPSIFGMATAQERVAAILASSKPNCRVLDYGGNFELHGPIDQIQPPPTPGEKKRKGEAPIKECLHCKALCFAGAKACHECGFKFPDTGPKISSTASSAAIVSSQIKAEWVKVDAVQYRFSMERQKKVMEVVYKCGMLVYKDRVRFEHEGKARQFAVNWWNRHEPNSKPPETVKEALARAEVLPKPTQVCLKPNGKYINVVGRRFD